MLLQCGLLSGVLRQLAHRGVSQRIAGQHAHRRAEGESATGAVGTNSGTSIGRCRPS